jgi:hypothetical protein
VDFPNANLGVCLTEPGGRELKVKDATFAEIAPKAIKPRPLSPRQLAIRKRELILGKALRELVDAPAGLLKKVELEDGEKLPTIRAAITRQIKNERMDVQLAVRSGAIYLGRGIFARERRAK